MQQQEQLCWAWAAHVWARVRDVAILKNSPRIFESSLHLHTRPQPPAHFHARILGAAHLMLRCEHVWPCGHLAIGTTAAATAAPATAAAAGIMLTSHLQLMASYY